MDTKNDVFEKSRSVRDMQHLRLMALLQELESDHGRKKAAALLGVDRRTLDASLDEGVLSRRIRGALDKALQYGWARRPQSNGTATTSCQTGWTTWRAASRRSPMRRAPDAGPARRRPVPCGRSIPRRTGRWSGRWPT